jgi:hypothetical protein
MATGKIVTTIITRAELNPVILIPNTRLAKKTLSVTTAMDNTNERATLAMTFICLKKTSVQAKPGRKNTNMNPKIALTMGKRSRRGKTNLTSSLIGFSQSTPYLPLSIDLPK